MKQALGEKGGTVSVSQQALSRVQGRASMISSGLTSSRPGRSRNWSQTPVKLFFNQPPLFCPELPSRATSSSMPPGQASLCQCQWLLVVPHPKQMDKLQPAHQRSPKDEAHHSDADTGCKMDTLQAYKRTLLLSPTGELASRFPPHKQRVWRWTLCPGDSCFSPLLLQAAK